MTDKANQAAELLHKLTSSGMFPALKLAMQKYARSQTDADWMQVIKEFGLERECSMNQIIGLVN